MKPSLTKERRAWLASLKEGDEVAIVSSQGVAERIGTCARAHPSWAPVVFRIGRDNFGATGREMGYRGRDHLSYGSHMAPITDEIRHFIDTGRRLGEWRIRLNGNGWMRRDAVSDEQIAAIAKVLGWT